MRFELGERVRVLAHPVQPVGEITGRWTGAEAGDVYGEDIYAVSGFVTRQRESSLAREGFIALPLDAPGVFVRIPALGGSHPDRDAQPALVEGYEVQIDDRGVDPESGTAGSR